ncbi:zinc finger protein 34-like [Rhopilema esculentum]|uniref:zinc finger protein 34-like n=1 Tax=Rhopilema esculentum TaxID=499914 RepID=UPI0031E1A55F
MEATVEESNTDTYVASELGIDSVQSSDVLPHLRSNNSANGLGRGEPGESFTRQERSCVSKELHTADKPSYIESDEDSDDFEETKLTNKLEQSAYNKSKLELFEHNVKEWYERTGVTAVTITFFEGYIRVVAPDHMDELKRNPLFKEFFLKALLQTSSSKNDNKMAVVSKEPEADSDLDVPVSCDKCDKSFSRQSQLRNHQLLMHLPKENSGHRCEKCGKIFQAAAFLQSHLCNRTGQRKHQCTICGTRFTSRSSLKMHLRGHNDEKPFKCQTCGKGFPRKSSLKYHLTKHTGEKDYQCSVCGKEFALLSNLKDHERIHSGEKPFSCQECGKSFTVSSTLRRHLLVHSGEKPFHCEVCHSRFTRMIHLQSHMRVHSGEKPYQCNECNKSFTQSSHLKRHKKIHERDRSQVCIKCGQELKLKDKNKHTCPPQNPANPLRQLTFPYNFAQA